MTDNYIQLRKIHYKGPSKNAELEFGPGVNVICGASDTGKSFLVDSIDFMLGGSRLKEIPERDSYGEIDLELSISNGENWLLHRAISGGSFKLENLNDIDDSELVVLKQSHSHGKADNLSGFLLEIIGLLGQRILRSKVKGTTQSLSFRNLARLVIVQEGEIQQTGSPFWGGQYTLKTAELASIKLMLLGVDDSSVVSRVKPTVDNSNQLAFIEELLSDLASEIVDIGAEESEVTEQLSKLENSVEEHNIALRSVQNHLDVMLSDRKEVFENQEELRARLDEISEHQSRFELLRAHYQVDVERLEAIQESGSMFAHFSKSICPLCGASPSDQHMVGECDGNVDAVVQAASAEILKIERLRNELAATTAELSAELEEIKPILAEKEAEFKKLDLEIRESLAPNVGDMRIGFSTLVEKRENVRNSAGLFSKVARLEEQREMLIAGEEDAGEDAEIEAGLPAAISHTFSLKIATILKAWGYPGDCHVHFDKETSDFVIDGKLRGSTGKGLRAITHAAITIGLLEFCQEQGLSHPGFVVLDSPLLAYFKPEGEEDIALRNSDLKERFYDYLIMHHNTDSQVVIIENQHPPDSVANRLAMTIFTGNPDSGRYGLL